MCTHAVHHQLLKLYFLSCMSLSLSLYCRFLKPMYWYHLLTLNIMYIYFIGCYFLQPSDSVEVCKFNLKNEADWKSMSQDAILSVCGPGASPSWPCMPPLCCSSLDSSLVSNDLEQQLRVMVYEHRRVCQLTNQKTNPYFRPTFVIHVPGISVSFKCMLLTTHIVLLYN